MTVKWADRSFAQAENKHAHAAILEAAQSVQRTRFLDDEDDYTEEPRQLI